MKRLFVLSAIIIFTGLPMCSVAQVPMQSSHQPTTTATAPGPVSDKSPQTLIARVNGVTLTGVQLDEELQRLFPYYAIHGNRLPAPAEAELREQAIHDMVLHELVYQEARRRNLQIPPQTWQKRLQQLRQGFSSRKAYEAAATKKYGSMAAFERRLRRVMLIQQLLDAEVTRKSVVTVAASRKYYVDHKSQYLRPESVWLQTITIKFPSSATVEQKQQAHKIASEILAKAKAENSYDGFGMLAQQLSQDDWRVMMGDHRWVHRAAVAPELAQAVFALKAGEISGVVESSNGYIILRANDHQQPRQMSFAEMNTSIRKDLAKELRDKRSKEFEAQLRTKARVEIL
jgi:parvulin-like peptidyl-prolyl isomerase